MTERPLLVLLHGWGSTAAVWQPVLEHLQDRFECYLPELPGHGDSAFTATQLESLAQQILESAHRPAIWLGWSLGALIAMQAALLMTEQVKQLVVVSGTPAFVQHAGWNSAMPVKTFDQFKSGFSADANKTLRRFIALQGLGDQQAKAVTQQLSRALVKNTDAITWGLEVLHSGNLLEDLSAIACPVHCLYGENDALVPVAVQEVMGEKAGAQVSVWPDTGHAPFLSRPDAFADWVEQVILHG